MLDLLLPLLYSFSALGLGVLCLPIALSLHFQREGLPANWQLLVQLAFVGGAIGLGFRFDEQHRFLVPVILGKAMPFPILSLKSKANKTKKESKTSDQVTSPKSSKDRVDKTQEGGLIGMLRLLLKPGLKLLISLPQTIGLKQLSIKGSVGFTNPAQTGTLSSYLQAIKYFKNNKIKIDVGPDFIRPGAFGQLEFVAHFHLGLLLLLFGRFGLHVAYRFLAVRLLRRQPGLI